VKARKPRVRRAKPGVSKRTCAPEEWNTRVELAAFYRLLVKHGMSELTGTHVSALVPGSEKHFLLNPFGLLFEEVTASNLVKCDYDGRIVDETEYALNPAGIAIHGAVHKARPDAFCVAHTHARAGVVVGALRCGLLPLSQTSLIFYDRVAYTDYSWADEGDSCEQLVADLGDKYCLFMRNHGLLTTGRTIGEAFVLMHRLNVACQIQMEALSTGQEVVLPREDVCRQTAQAWWEYEPWFGQRAWNALVRQLDREDVAYRR
jgi:ribulose-5-phosphate 4-epimerase/fuculose-1-phosphate aldolase